MLKIANVSGFHQRWEKGWCKLEKLEVKHKNNKRIYSLIWVNSL
jgi:hypothetical protein